MTRSIRAAALMAIGIVLATPPAVAHADDLDAQFLQALHDKGIPQLNAAADAKLIGLAHDTCADGLTGTPRTADKMRGVGIDPATTITILTTAVRVYCPSELPKNMPPGV